MQEARVVSSTHRGTVPGFLAIVPVGALERIVGIVEQVGDV
jgi:hypothetical protein